MAVADPGKGPREPEPRFFSVELRPDGPKKKFGGRPGPALSQGLNDQVQPPPSEGLDPPLNGSKYITMFD